MPDLVPQWAAVVPVKGGPLAKSRLALPEPARRDLANAFAHDTVSALLDAIEGMPVLVVTSAPTVARRRVPPSAWWARSPACWWWSAP